MFSETFFSVEEMLSFETGPLQAMRAAWADQKNTLHLMLQTTKDFVKDPRYFKDLQRLLYLTTSLLTDLSKGSPLAFSSHTVISQKAFTTMLAPPKHI